MARIDDGSRPIAETYRQVCSVAEKLGVARPSYEQTRAILHQLRARKRDPEIGQILLDISCTLSRGRECPDYLSNSLLQGI